MFKVTVSIIFAILIGMVWYSYNAGFGRIWSSNAWPSKSYADILKMQADNSSFVYGMTLFANSITMILFHIILRAVRPLTLADYLSTSVLLSLLLLSTRMIHAPFESVPLLVHLINGGYDFAILLVSSTIHYFLR